MEKTKRNCKNKVAKWYDSSGGITLVLSPWDWKKRIEVEKVSGVTRKTLKKVSLSFVVCVDNSHYPASLELHKIYVVLPDKKALGDGYIRVIDESGEDYLYPSIRFVSIQVPHALKKSLEKAS